MIQILLVGMGGFVGAIARYGVGLWAVRHWGSNLPVGTFIVNITGSFILGLFATLAARFGWADGWRLLIAVGFVGAYTTFSTFEWETLQLIGSDGQSYIAALNVLGSVAAGLLAALIGSTLGSITYNWLRGAPPTP